MVEFKEGDIFDSECQTIVNTINCVGVMGKGIALAFKERFPAMYQKYRQHCDNRLIHIGVLWLYKSTGRWVLNFPTKEHWRNPSKYEYLERGLEKFLLTYKEKGITSIAFPLLGTDNGGLDKEKVKKLMVRYLSKVDIPVEIWEYKV